MIEIRRILCPIDFSDFSRRALDHAGAIAKWYDAAVTVFHVSSIVPTAAYAPGSPVLPSMVLTEQDRDELLMAMKQFAAVDAGSPLQFECAEGSAATEILAKADGMRADLLVMGTHGRSGFERLVLGSVTEKVLRKATCPVLSVPRRVPGAVSPQVLFKRILCAVDFSDCSMRALNYAMSLAQEADARLTVVHVVELLTRPPDLHETTVGGPRSLEEYLAAAEDDARERLTAAVPDTVRAYCAVETVVARDKPYGEILRIASEQASDLIVIGIHGRGAVDLMFFGSTAQHVVRRTSCPVLTLRKNAASED